MDDNAKHESCIVKHFGSYANLDPEDEELLASLEKSPKTLPADAVVCHQGDAANGFFTVMKGWLYSYRDLEDGSRQVLDVFVPGDVVGLREFAFSHRLTGVKTLTEAVLCEFPKSRLPEIFTHSLLLSNLFFAIAAREQAVLLERMINLGRRSATQKVAHFTLEMFARLKRTNSCSLGQFTMPLPQHILSDALGLSAVHISRTFTELKQEGLVLRNGTTILIPDIERLIDFAGFSPYYLEENVPRMPLLEA